MYQSNTIRQCLWLIATIRQNGRLTLKALQEKWTADKMGDTLHRSSFNRYRDKIFELFGLVMECDEKYQYYFQNPGELTDHSIERKIRPRPIPISLMTSVLRPTSSANC